MSKKQPIARNDNEPGAAPAKRCPLCGKPADAHYRPFCSKCCADIDLNRWFTGSYAIPAVEGEEDDEEQK